MLWLVQRVFFGPLKEPVNDDGHDSVRDLNGREIMALAPLAVFVVWIGVQPRFFLERMSGDLDRLTNVAQQRFVDQQRTLRQSAITLRQQQRTETDR